MIVRSSMLRNTRPSSSTVSPSSSFFAASGFSRYMRSALATKREPRNSSGTSRHVEWCTMTVSSSAFSAASLFAQCSESGGGLKILTSRP